MCRMHRTVAAHTTADKFSCQHLIRLGAILALGVKRTLGLAQGLRVSRLSGSLVSGLKQGTQDGKPISLPLHTGIAQGRKETNYCHIGDLKSNDAEGNDNVKKKTIGFISKTKALHVRHPFLYISLPVFARLRRESAQLRVGGRKFYFSFCTWIWSQEIQHQEGSPSFDKVVKASGQE